MQDQRQGNTSDLLQKYQTYDNYSPQIPVTNKQVMLNSPGKKKQKLGALYNPNNLDPRKIAMDQEQIAGIKTNYGYLNTDEQQKSKSLIKGNMRAGNPYKNETINSSPSGRFNAQLIQRDGGRSGLSQIGL